MNWEKSKSLSSLQKDILKRFFELRQDFFLTGGAALGGFYLDHRRSNDVDLFTPGKIDWPELIGAIEWLSREIGAKCERLTEYPYIHRFKLSRGEEQQIVDLVHDFTQQIDDAKNHFGEIIVDTPREILANKLCTLLGRSEIRDLIDLYCLAQSGYNPLEYVELSLTKDGGMRPELLAKILSEIRINELPTENLLREISVEDLKKFIERLIDGLVLISFPEE